MKLPLNCEANYYESFLSSEEAQILFIKLNQLIQKTTFTPQTINGKSYHVNFGKIMFVDQELINNFPEEHWGPTSVWFKELRKVKDKIQQLTGHTFQTCVMIYYPDGNSGIDFHSDYVAFGDTSIIPSISLGEERLFTFREKANGNEFSTLLANGSLIIMGEHCQENYEHSLPTNSKYKNARINLTFRKYGFTN